VLNSPINFRDPFGLICVWYNNESEIIAYDPEMDADDCWIFGGEWIDDTPTVITATDDGPPTGIPVHSCVLVTIGGVPVGNSCTYPVSGVANLEEIKEKIKQWMRDHPLDATLTIGPLAFTVAYDAERNVLCGGLGGGYGFTVGTPGASITLTHSGCRKLPE
jgi:hypothetical protein